MQEIMRIQADENDASSHSLVLGIATTAEEVEQLQRLRYEVYTNEMNVVFPGAVNGVDIEPFDKWCVHLMVRDLKTDAVVGTYRILSPEKAAEAGGYYSEQEFNIDQLAHIRHVLCECGRSCTHPDYRNGQAIMLLWNGLARYLLSNNYRYMLGCASVSLADGGVQASKVWRAARRDIDAHPDRPTMVPINPYPLDKLTLTDDAKTPALIKGYLKIGAHICGEPAYDRDFNSADFPVIIDVANIDPRYKKHFGLD